MEYGYLGPHSTVFPHKTLEEVHTTLGAGGWNSQKVDFDVREILTSGRLGLLLICSADQSCRKLISVYNVGHPPHTQAQ